MVLSFLFKLSIIDLRGNVFLKETGGFSLGLVCDMAKVFCIKTHIIPSRQPLIVSVKGF